MIPNNVRAMAKHQVGSRTKKTRTAKKERKERNQKTR